jgi:excisionase family DNA binding protein
MAEHGHMRPAEFAKHFRCSRRHVYNLIARGELKHFRLGGKLIVIHRDEVARWENCAGSAMSRDPETKPLLPPGIQGPKSPIIGPSVPGGEHVA